MLALNGRRRILHLTICAIKIKKMELINQTISILEQAPELIMNSAISETIKGLFSWLKRKIKKESAIQKLEIIEQNNHNEKIITEFKSILEFVLEDNKEMQEQLAEKIDIIKKQIKIYDNPNSISKSNSIIVKDRNISFQDVNIKGDFSINQ